MLRPYYFFICWLLLGICYHGVAQKLYFTENGVVKSINFDGTGLSILPVSAGRYVAVDAGEGYLFYSNIEDVFRSGLDGSGEVQLTDFGPMAGFDQMDLVPDDQQIVYVGIEDMDDIHLGSFYDTPSDVQTNINPTPEEDFADISFNRSSYNLYYSDNNGVIYEADLTGTSYLPIVTNNAYGPLSVDPVNNMLYYVRKVTTNYEIVRLNLSTFVTTPVRDNGTTEITNLDVYPELNRIFFGTSSGLFSISYTNTGYTSIYSGSNIEDFAVAFDVTAPVFNTLAPTSGSIDVIRNSNLGMTFSENVSISTVAGTANETSIRIFQTAGNALVQTIARGDANITIANNVVTISGITTPIYNTDYYVLIGNKVFKDNVGNNFVGITLPTGWNFKTEPDPSIFYSMQNGNWGSASTWSHVGHAGPAATETPGTGSDVYIGNGHTVMLTGNTSVVANTAGVLIEAGGTLNATGQEFHVWGPLQIDGQLINGGILSGMFELHSTSGIPVFNEIQYGVSGYPNAAAEIFTNVVALNGISSIDGGTLNTNGFQICVPPTPPPSSVTFTNITSNSLTLNWAAGGGAAFVVAREGSTSFRPTFGTPYIANASFGAGPTVGTGNYVVYSGGGTSVSITGLSPATNYEFDLYSFSTSIGGCYSVQNYITEAVTSCIILPAPTGAVNAQYCAGETKPALNVNSPGSGRSINWYDAPTGGNLVPGDVSGGDGRGGVFIPSAASGTFFAETYDGTFACSSATRTAVTLTVHPPLVVTASTGGQSVCSGGDPTVLDGGLASGGTGSYTYQWESGLVYTGPFADIVGATSATYDPPTGITQTTYYRRLTKAATCTQTSGLIVVTVTNAPVITSQPTSPLSCDGKTATFSITATGTTLTYQWKVDNGSGFVNINNTGVYSGATTNQLQISNVTGLNNVRYQCEVFSGGTCPVTSSTVPLIVSPNPTVANQAQTICETVVGSGTGSVDLTALNTALTNGAGGFTVSWFTNAAMTTPVPNPANTTASNGTIFYGRVSSNSTGCSSPASVTISVTSKPGGAGNIAGPLSMCANTPGAFTVTGISNATQFDWQVTSGLEIVSENSATASIQAASGTTGTITVTGENSCGKGIPATLTVQILPTPEVQIIVPTEIVEGEPATFSFESASGPFKNILWDLGDNATSAEEVPQHTYSSDGSYTVTLTVLDNSNCENTEEVNVTVLMIPELGENDIKNVITANGDTKNGYLYIENLEKYPSNQVVLLDRWGVEVFKQENYTNDWDARKNGDYLPAGQYVCVVKLNETGKIFSRTVSIIKRK